MILPRAAVLLTLVACAGCAHRGVGDRTQAELAFVGPYAAALASGCSDKFTLERTRRGTVIATSRGVQETQVRLEACKAVVATVLDCHLPIPEQGLGWDCDAHTLPTPEGMHRRRELTSEILVLYGALAAAGCDASPSGRDLVERTRHDVVNTKPWVLRSRWTVTGCGRQWTAETQCVTAGVDWDGEGECTLVHFEEAAAASEAPSAEAAAQAPSAALGGLTVRVVDAEARPLPGTSVRIEGPKLIAPRQLLAGPTGDLEVRDLPPGEYTLHFEREGFRARSTTGVVISEKRITRVVPVVLMPDR